MNRMMLSLGAASALLVALPVHADDEFGIGAVGGLSTSKLNGFAPVVATLPQPTADISRLIGGGGGLVLEYGIFRVELKYQQKGQKQTVTATSGSVEEKAALSYIDVPIMFKSNLFKSHPVHPYIMSGLSPSFLTSAKLQVAGQSDIDLKSAFKSFELGLIACVGVQAPAGKGTFYADVRVHSSLLRIDNQSAVDKDSILTGVTLPTAFAPKLINTNTKNTAFELTVSYVVPLGK